MGRDNYCCCELRALIPAARSTFRAFSEARSTRVAIYDTLQFIRPDEQMIRYGIAISMGSLLLASF